MRRKLARSGLDPVAADIERIHTRLLKQRQCRIDALAHDSEEGVTIGHCFVLWQAGLHRIERLMITCGSAVSNNDVYGLATMLRALVESTAVITSICAQMHARAEGTVTYEVFDSAVTSALTGSRSPLVEGGPSATNILTHIRKADRFIDERRLCPIPSPLATMYDVLSEFAHPNMTSNSCAFEIPEVGIYVFNHGGDLTQRQIDLVGFFGTTVQVYEKVSDFFHGLLTKPVEPTQPAEVVRLHTSG